MDDTPTGVDEMELVALVFMLCSPSELNLTWANPERAAALRLRADADSVLNDLPFSENAKAKARGLMQRADAKAAFDAVAQQLKPFWGKEPHPDSGAAKKIVAAIRNTPMPA